jgi:FkbM family methyltransferase
VRRGIARGARLELDLQTEKRYWLGRYEPETQEFLRANVRAGDVVYDVGAHVGFFSVCAALLGARVYAFEPAPENARRIRRQAELNDLPIEVVEAAVWDSDRGVHLLAGDWTSEYRTAPDGSIASVALDDFVRDHERPDLAKIDVEGAEGRVLRGAARLLEAHRPTLLCEVHGEEARADVLGLLRGYDVADVGSRWRIGASPVRHTIEQ